MFFDQQEFDIRCEWGEVGVSVLAPISNVVVIVDVLSFSTCVDIAVHHGAIVFPAQWDDESAVKFAVSINAELADPKRTKGKYSLSPESLMNISSGTWIVLPSPNGATLTLKAQPTPVLAGCLRNAHAIALAVMKYGTKAFQLSERRVCRALGQPRSTQRYQNRKAGDEENLVLRVAELASQYGRYGYRRITALLQKEGWCVNRFIHRFLQHVLPKHFVKVRYYDLFAPTLRTRLTTLHHSLSHSRSRSTPCRPG